LSSGAAIAHGELRLFLSAPLAVGEVTIPAVMICASMPRRCFLFTLSILSVLLPIPGHAAQTRYGVRMVQDWIPISDGVRLATTLYTPDGANPNEKSPALLDSLPSRKDDSTAAGDYPIHSYFARHGYVSVRVDIRGFGASEGAPTDREYSEREQL